MARYSYRDIGYWILRQFVAEPIPKIQYLQSGLHEKLGAREEMNVLRIRVKSGFTADCPPALRAKTGTGLRSET